MKYVATLGFSPAPIVLGLSVLTTDLSKLEKIILIPQDNNISKQKSTHNLCKFLIRHFCINVELSKFPSGTFVDMQDQIAELFEPGDYVNITGGAKYLTFACLSTVTNLNVFTVDGFNRPTTVSFITSLQKIDVQPAPSLLLAQHYLDLHFPEWQIANETFCDVDGAIHVLSNRGSVKAIAVRKNIPYVFQAELIDDQDKSSKMREHARQARTLAGIFAVPVFEYLKDLSDKETEEILEHARFHRGIAITSGDYEWLEKHSPLSSNASQEPNFQIASDPSKTSLIALVSDQPMPIVLSQGFVKAEQLILITSDEKNHIAQRLAKHFDDLSVYIFSGFGPNNPNDLALLINTLCNFHSNTVHLNLNGGTSLMAATAYLNRSNAKSNYILGKQFIPLSNEPIKETNVSLDIPKVLHLHGWVLESYSNFVMDDELYGLALACFEEYGQPTFKGGIETCKQWHNFKQRICKLNNFDISKIKNGIAGEYAIYYELKTVLKDSNAQIYSACTITSSLDGESHVQFEVDCLALYKGELLAIEVKNQLKNALNNREQNKLIHTQEDMGGHFARGLLVVIKKGNLSRIENLDQKLRVNNPITKIGPTVAIRTGSDNFIGFPPAKQTNPIDLLTAWNWL